MTMGLRGLAALAAVLLLSSNGVVAKILDKTWHFDEEELDSRMWTPETGNGCPELCGWGNMEAAAYGDSTRNVRVEDGKLKLLVTNDESGVDPNFPVISGKVTSKHQFGLLYGTVEASIRFPENCQGLWPAFWLLPRDDKYGKWPLSGEIDIFEAKNNMDDGATCAIHFPGGLKRGFTTLGDPRQFHKFRLEWSAGLIQYYFDDELYFEAKENWNVPKGGVMPAPFNEMYYIVFNLAVGGVKTSYTGQVPADQQCIEDKYPAMEVDYIRVITELCGNTDCDGDETCDTCPKDCGACPDLGSITNLPSPPDQLECLDPFNYPELEWTLSEHESPNPLDHSKDLRLLADLSIGPVHVVHPKTGQTLTTRGYNRMVPGPLIRLKACQSHRLTLHNDLLFYPNPSVGPNNVFKDPMTTNLLTLGVHMSSEIYADNPFVSVAPGTEHVYAWDIPCDHSGGTHIYQPSYSGSTTLQANAGAAGMIIIDDSDLSDAVTRPSEYQDMPEAVLVLMEMDPGRSREIARTTGDMIYESSVDDPFVMVNGCTSLEVPLEENQWTRLRMAFVGFSDSFFADFVPQLKAQACSIQLLSKDGVYLSEIPRSLPSGRLFFAPSSRVDVAIRCSEPGEHVVNMIAATGSGKTYDGVMTLTVRESSRQPDPVELPQWIPCRPTYLMDRMAQDSAGSLDLEVGEGTLNSLDYVKHSYIHKVDANSLYEWEIVGSGSHPLQFHMNHMQIVNIPEQWAGLPPEWMLPGDFSDTISAPSDVTARMYMDRFSGPLLVSSDSENADFGAKACIQVRSGFLPAKESDTWFPGAYGFPDILYPFPTNCPRTPYKGIGQPNLIPGLTEAEHFDRGGPGIAYSDWDSYNSGGPVAFRPAEGVDLQPDSKDWNDSGDNYYVGGLSPGEFLLYSMQVVESGTYTLEVQVASKVKDPTEIFVLFDADNCGVHGGGYTVADVKVEYSKGWARYRTYSFKNIKLSAGLHDMLVCIGTGEGSTIDSFIFLPADRAPGDVQGIFEHSSSWAWTGRPHSILYHPPPPLVHSTESAVVSAARALEEVDVADAVRVGNLRRRLLTRSSSASEQAWQARVNIIWQELQTLSSLKIPTLHVFADPMERGVATAIMDAAKESGMNVHISVPIGPTDMQNIRAVEFAVSLATLAEYEGMVQLFILGDRVLSYQTQNHMQKLTKHAMSLLNGHDIPVTIGESVFLYSDLGLWEGVDITYATCNPFQWYLPGYKSGNGPLKPISDNPNRATEWGSQAVYSAYRGLVQGSPRPMLLGGVGWPSSGPANNTLLLTSSEAAQMEFHVKAKMALAGFEESWIGQHVVWEVEEAFDRPGSSYGLFVAQGEPKLATKTLGSHDTTFSASVGSYVNLSYVMVTFAAIVVGLLSIWYAGYFEVAGADEVPREVGPTKELGGREYLKGFDEPVLCGEAEIMPVRRSRDLFTVYASTTTLVLLFGIVSFKCYTVYGELAGSHPAVIIMFCAFIFVLGICFCMYPLLVTVRRIFYIFTFPWVNKALGSNSEFYSARPEPINSSKSLLSVTIVMPVYNEDLQSVLAPTVASLIAAIRQFQSRGGKANLVIADDGLQVLDDAARAEREEFYSTISVDAGYAARPPHSILKRAGAFKKASNINYLHEVLRDVKQYMQQNTGISAEKATDAVAGSRNHLCIAKGKLWTGDLILLVDSDTRIPGECLSSVQAEFANDANVGYVQCRTTPLLMADERDVVLDTVAVMNADVYDYSIALECATGIVCPIVGHNCFLRMQALEDASHLLPAEEQGNIWAEDQVSEDFELMLRMSASNYYGRYVMYTGADFKEGISLTADDELARQARFAYGAMNVMINSPRVWFQRGVLSPVWRSFFSADIPWTSKMSHFAYLMNYMAKSFCIYGIIFTLIMPMILPGNQAVFYIVNPLDFAIFLGLFVVIDAIASLIYRLTNSECSTWLHAISKSFGFVGLATCMSTMLHLATPFDATVVQAKYMMLKPGQVTFNATAKTSSTSGLLRKIAVSIQKRMLQNFVFFLISVYCFFIVGFPGISNLSFGPSVDMDKAVLFHFSWWWSYVTFHVLNPIFFIALQAWTSASVSPEPKMKGKAATKADAAGLHPNKATGFKQCAGLTPPLSPVNL